MNFKSLRGIKKSTLCAAQCMDEPCIPRYAKQNTTQELPDPLLSHLMIRAMPQDQGTQ